MLSSTVLSVLFALSPSVSTKPYLGGTIIIPVLQMGIQSFLRENTYLAQYHVARK